MDWMFHDASAFDQDLGWDTSASQMTESISAGTGLFTATDPAGAWPTRDTMRSLANEFSPVPGWTATYARHGNGDHGHFRKIRTAVAAWLTDATAAEANRPHLDLGHIGGDGRQLSRICSVRGSLAGHKQCGALASFNEDIGRGTPASQTGLRTFAAGAFDQDIGAWDTSERYRA